MGEHIHGQRDDVHVSGAFTVAEQGAFNAVAAGEQPQLCVRHAGSPVIVGMQGQNYAVSAVQVFAHVFHLVGEYMGHGHFHGRRQVDDDLVLRRGFPDIDDGVANLQRELRLCAGETLGRIFKFEVSVRVSGCDFIHQFRTVGGDFNDFFLILAEYLLSLGKGCGVIEMNHGVLCAYQRFKCFFNNMASGLRQYLHSHVVRNHILLNQSSQEFKFGI